METPAPRRGSLTFALSEVSRKALFRAALRTRRDAWRELELMRDAQWHHPDRVLAIQSERLEKILLYAHRHVPYYTRLLEQHGVVSGQRVRMDRFRDLPFLDKPTIRANFQAITSDEARRLKATPNRTGGSTGEPLEVLLDPAEVRVTGGVVLRLFYEWHGVRPGDPEVKLWGSTRDLFHTERWSLGELRQKVSGITLLNAFQMTPERMEQYIGVLNRLRPAVLRGYSSNLYELAQFAHERGLAVHPPGRVFSSAGTLYPHLRARMEKVYGCRVFNHYGSREVHSVAMECPVADGLHLSAFTHLVEVLDEQGRPCPPGVDGDLVITNLLNRAMPLIRYRIGDRGSLAQGTCACGRGLPRLAQVSGRRVDCFWTRDRRMIPGEYFIYLLGVHIDDNPFRKYQVVQEDFDDVVYRLVLQAGRSLSDDLRQTIVKDTRLVMGERCEVSFELLEDIPPSPSGKYSYSLCRIPDVSQPTVPSGGEG